MGPQEDPDWCEANWSAELRSTCARLKSSIGSATVKPCFSPLTERGVELSPPIYQEDQAYAPNGWSYGDSKLGIPFLRLRTVSGQHVFTLKCPRENALSCEEYQTGIVDRDQMHHAIIAIGF